MRNLTLYTRLWVTALALISVAPHAQAATFEEYVQRLTDHPQIASILAQSDAAQAQAQGELGLPDPVVTIGVDNVPVSDPSFDRFLPTAKLIGFNQKIPNPALRAAKSGRLDQLSKKFALVADYTKARMRFMLIAKLAEYQSAKTRKALIKKQLEYYTALENTFEGQVESGGSQYQRFSEIDVERAEAERKLNNLDADITAIEAEFIRLVGDVPALDVPDVPDMQWDETPDALYPVMIAAQDIDIASKSVGVAEAAFLPDFGVNAIYKQRESGEHNSFNGDDWFSLQAQITIPLWADKNQKPKLKAAKDQERSAQFAYDDMARQWIQQMTALHAARDAAGRNVKVLQGKDWAMKKKIAAAERNYEAGTENLDSVLLAKIDRLNIQSQRAIVKALYVSRSAEFNANIIGAYQEVSK